MSFVIRPARDADGAALAALIGGCWAEYPGCDVPVEAEIPEIGGLASSYAAEGGVLWVGETAGTIIGMAGLKPGGDGPKNSNLENSNWEVSKMYVAAMARGTGLAQDLLALAEDHARSHGAARAFLWSDTRLHRAHRFYEKQGYVRVGGVRALHDLANSLEYCYEKTLSGEGP